MTSKIEVIGDTLKGPYTIKINGTEITDIESYNFYHDENYVHRFTITLLADNFQLRRSTKKDKTKLGSMSHIARKS